MSNKPLPKVKTQEYRLPLPLSGKELIYRPYNVRDEKILITAAMSKNDDPEFYIDNTLNVLKGIVLNDVVLDTLPAAEVDLLMLNVRGKSAGEDIEFTYKDEDDNKIVASVNTDEFYVTERKEELYDIKITDDIGIKMQDITFADKIRYGTRFSENPTEIIYESIVDCVSMVYQGDDVWIPDEDVTRDEVKEFIEQLTSTSQKLYDFIQNQPVIACEATLSDGSKRTFTSREVDFLSSRSAT